jgi:mono/diheme cytochrome c family protein
MNRLCTALLSICVFTLPACDGGGDKPAEAPKPAAPADAPAAPTGTVAPTGAAAPTAAVAPTAAPAATGVAAATGSVAPTGAAAPTGPAEADKPEADKPETDEPKMDKPKSDKPKADLSAGKTLYMKKCKNCHGASGDSDTKMGRKLEIPPLNKSKTSLSKMRKTIENGVADTKMKAYKSKLSAEEITDVTAFVHSL